MDSVSKWENLPDLNLLMIFHRLSVRDLLNSSLVCKRWNSLAQNNLLWNRFYIRDFFYSRWRRKPMPEPLKDLDEDWKRRYLQNIYTVPRVPAKVLRIHRDEVLHVSFSNDGQYFVSSSKDCKIVIWRTSDYEPEEIHDMRLYGWIFTRAGQFSPSDRRLMVAGVINEMGGELVIMERSSKPPYPFKTICRVINDPYDVMGCWWTDKYFISGSIFTGFEGGFQASLWLCEPPSLSSPDEEEDEEEEKCTAERLISVNCYKCCLFKFQSFLGSYLRNVISLSLNHLRSVAPDPHRTPPPSSDSEDDFIDEEILKILENNLAGQYLAFTCSDSTTIPHKIGFYKLTREGFSFTPVISAPDISIELNGHAVGLSTSKDRRFMYVNVRMWPENSVLSIYDYPAISTEIQMKVIDLSNFEILPDLMFFGHRGFTTSDSAFYLHLDTSNNFIASGSENGRGIVWERSTGIKLAEIYHDACINYVAFDPYDEETCISVSDDCTLKVWKSVNRFKSSELRDEEVLQRFCSNVLI